MRRVGILAAVVVLVLQAGGSRASADCAGPVVEVSPASGEPGTALTVTGRYWGTDCYDTGPPPPGVGPLGLPDTGIEVTFVDAAGTSTPLGTVDAVDDYTIRLDAAVPAGAAAGEGRIEAVSNTGFLVTPAPFVVGTDVVAATPPYTG